MIPQYLTPIEFRPKTLETEEGSDSQKLLTMCEEIRTKLDNSILMGFPMYELDNQQERKTTFLGFTFLVCNCQGTMETEKLGVILRNKQGHLFEPIRVIPTLIHEFAHVVREAKRTNMNSREQSSETGHDCHDNLFYDCFHDLLLKAQELGIYELPTSFKAKTHAILRRFDKVDLEKCPLSQCGRSSYQPEEKKLKFIVCDAKGTKKPVALNDGTTEELLKISAQKLKMKQKPKGIVTLQGLPVTNDNLNTFPEDTILRIQ